MLLPNICSGLSPWGGRLGNRLKSPYTADVTWEVCYASFASMLHTTVPANVRAGRTAIADFNIHSSNSVEAPEKDRVSTATATAIKRALRCDDRAGATYNVTGGRKRPNARRKVLLISPTVAYDSTACAMCGITFSLVAATSSNF